MTNIPELYWLDYNEGMDIQTKIEIIGIVIAILIPIIGLIMKLIIGPKIEFDVPRRDVRPWLSFSETDKTANLYNAMLTAGTATLYNVEHIQNQKEIEQPIVSVRYYIYIPIRNDTKWRFESTAKDVHAKLIIYNLQKTKIGEFDARWQSTNQPRFLENKSPLKKINISAGETENLDIASRLVNGSEWYVMNNDSYDNPYNSEIPDNKIGNGGFIFCIKLNGENIDSKEIIYKVLDNDGAEPSYIKLENIR